MTDTQKDSVKELATGITTEEITAMYFDADALVAAPYRIWQLNSKGQRYYYLFNETGTPEFYPSVTTILSRTLPKEQSLINWIASKGVDVAEQYAMLRSYYGTFMHAAFEDLLINREYDLDLLKSKLKDFIEINKLPDSFIYHADELKKDLLAFAQFVVDYEVKPLAIEIALVHPEYKFAGMIDLPCTMLDKIGSDKRINAIIDFKSGRKGFWQDAEIQLGLYRMLWDVNFEDMPIERIFNFSPKDWRKKPTYNLKEQTDSPNLKKIPYLLELAAIEDDKQDNIFVSATGIITLDKPNLTDNIISLTLSDLVKSKKDKKSNSKSKVTRKASKAPKKAKKKPANEEKEEKRSRVQPRARKARKSPENK